MYCPSIEKNECRVQAIWRLPNNINVDHLRGDPNKLVAIPEGTDPTHLAIYGKSVGEEFQQADNNWGQNPWCAAYQHINDDTRDRFIASGQARYDITDWLYVSGRIGLDRYTRRDKTLVPQGVGYQRGGAITEGTDVVREINRHGVTVLLVEQNVHNALSIASRAYVVETGRIAASRDAASLLNDPALLNAYLGGEALA